MSVAQFFFTAFVLLGGLYWLVKAVLAARAIRATPVLADMTPPPPARWPRVSIIIPACNEAATIEAAVRSQLAQDYPDLEFVLINDRSTDATGEIVERLAATDVRVRALHIDRLPEGWLGKVNALNTGVRESTGEWLLFIDADVHLAPTTIRDAIAYCTARDREHLALLPTFKPASFWLDVALASFMRLGIIGSRPWAIENPRSRTSIGVGAFNLVKRAALGRTPGFEWLRMEVVDDIGLGQLLKRNGVRSSLALGRDRVSLHWYYSLREMLRGTEKNAFAALARFNYWRLLAFVLIYPALEVSPLLAFLPLGANWLPMVGGVALLCALFSITLLARWLRQPVLPGLVFPIGAVLVAFAALRSGVLALLRGGLMWRGTLYPTARLREGQRYRFI